MIALCQFSKQLAIAARSSTIDRGLSRAKPRQIVDYFFCERGKFYEKKALCLPLAVGRFIHSNFIRLRIELGIIPKCMVVPLEPTTMLEFFEGG